MSIRVTNTGMVNQSISDINRNLRKLQELQLMLSTNKSINKPSDDPVGLVKVMKLNDSLTKNDQYLSNVEDGRARLSATSNTLSSVNDLLLQIRALAEDSITPTASVTTSVLAHEIDGLMDEIYSNSNKKYLGKYLFGGVESLSQPYNATFNASGAITAVVRNEVRIGGSGAVIKGIDTKIMHTAMEGLNIQINISGSLPFMPNGETGTNNLFDVLIRLRDNVQAGDINQIKAIIPELDNVYNNVTFQESVVGERLRHLETYKSSNEQTEVITKENLSQVQDIDAARTITELNYQQTVLQSALQVGAKIIPASLLDFI